MGLIMNYNSMLTRMETLKRMVNIFAARDEDKR